MEEKEDKVGRLEKGDKEGGKESFEQCWCLVAISKQTIQILMKVRP